MLQTSGRWWATSACGLRSGYPCFRKAVRTTKVSCRGTIRRASVILIDLVGGRMGGTFYIRARLRAGACVPADNETLGP